ncbi:large ribosomal subunit protein eL24-like [Rosa sericea]
MVLTTKLCRFSGAKIYPGRGIRFIHSDSQVSLFINSKCKRYFNNRLKPSKITWTAMFRKQHKKVGSAAAYLETGIFSSWRYSILLISSVLIITWLNLSNDVMISIQEQIKTR